MRQRVGNLRELLGGMGIEAFSRHIVEAVCDSAVTLDSEDVARIEEISQGYMLESFIKGRNPKH